MPQIYCVGCHQARMVYRTWSVLDRAGGETLRGTCPICGREISIAASNTVAGSVPLGTSARTGFSLSHAASCSVLEAALKRNTRKRR